MLARYIARDRARGLNPAGFSLNREQAEMVYKKRVGTGPKSRQHIAAFIPDEEQPDMIDAASARAALGEKLGVEPDAVDSTIHVYLIEGDPKQDNKIWQGDAENYNLEALAKTFGSGTYRVKAYARNADGYKPLIFNFVQPWKLSPDDEAKVIAAREAAKNPPPPDRQNGYDSQNLVAAMMAGFETLAARLAPPPPPDPLAQFAQFATIMKTLAPTTAGPDLGAMLGMLKTLKDIAGDGANADPTAALLAKAADNFFPVLAAGLTKQPEAATVQAALPAPGPALTEEQEHMKIIDQLKVKAFQLQLKMAVKAAARMVPARTYADTIYDAFDADDIEGLALAPDWWAIMCKAEPGCEPHHEWFIRVRDAIIEIAIDEGILRRDADGHLTTADEGSRTETPNPEKAADNGAPRNPAGAAIE